MNEDLQLSLRTALDFHKSITYFIKVIRQRILDRELSDEMVLFLFDFLQFFSTAEIVLADVIAQLNARYSMLGKDGLEKQLSFEFFEEDDYE